MRPMTFWGFIADFALVAGAFGLLGFTVWAEIRGPILSAVPTGWQLLLMTLTCSFLVGVGVSNIIRRR